MQLGRKSGEIYRKDDFSVNRKTFFCLFLALAAGSLVALPGCAKKSAPSNTIGQPTAAVIEPEEAVSSSAEVKDWDPTLGTASVTGSVVFLVRNIY